MSPRTRVRAHKVRRNGRTYVRHAHDRRDPTRRGPDAWNLSARRAVRNAKRARRNLRGGRNVRAALWGTGAACELTAVTILRPIGSVLLVTGGVLFMIALHMREHR